MVGGVKKRVIGLVSEVNCPVHGHKWDSQIKESFDVFPVRLSILYQINDSTIRRNGRIAEAWASGFV